MVHSYRTYNCCLYYVISSQGNVQRSLCTELVGRRLGGWWIYKRRKSVVHILHYMRGSVSSIQFSWTWYVSRDLDSGVNLLEFCGQKSVISLLVNMSKILQLWQSISLLMNITKEVASYILHMWTKLFFLFGPSAYMEGHDLWNIPQPATRGAITINYVHLYIQQLNICIHAVTSCCGCCCSTVFSYL